MNSVVIDWRFVVAVGAATVGIIFAVKMSPKDAAAVSIHAIDAYKDYAIAANSLCYFCYYNICPLVYGSQP